jgi:ParB family chromosome partitioning protein
LAEFWEPTAENYLSRVLKDKVIDALKEAGESPDNLMAFRAMKKPTLAPKAEKALAGTRWLPKPLRMPEGANDDALAASLGSFLDNTLGKDKAASLRSHQRQMMEQDEGDEAA